MSISKISLAHVGPGPVYEIIWPWPVIYPGLGLQFLQQPCPEFEAGGGI